MKVSTFHLLVFFCIALGCLLFFLIQSKPSTLQHSKISQIQKNSNAKYIMAYVYNDILAKNPNRYYSQSIMQTGNAVNEVSPPYFTIKADGTLDSKMVNRDFITEMHQKSIKVVPFLSDQWNASKSIAALKNKDKLVSEIVKSIAKYDLNGVNVDIEYITEKNRQEYNDFVKLLRKSLPAKKLVTVAVAANPYQWTNGWQGAYDDSTLSKNSDYLMLMAYDEHAQDDKISGPVAGLPFVEKSIQYALSQNVPSQKIVLGIPFYGRLWKEDGSILGLDVSLKIAENLINKYNGKVIYDQKYQSPKATFTIHQTDELTKIEKWDKLLTPGSYTLWYENEASIKAKLELVQKYTLKGTGIWSLGQEKPHTWDYYKSWLNNPPIQ